MTQLRDGPDRGIQCRPAAHDDLELLHALAVDVEGLHRQLVPQDALSVSRRGVRREGLAYAGASSAKKKLSPFHYPDISISTMENHTRLDLSPRK